MPSTSKSQARLFTMAQAIKHGHKLEGLRPGTMAKLHGIAERMSDAELEKMKKVKKK